MVRVLLKERTNPIIKSYVIHWTMIKFKITIWRFWWTRHFAQRQCVGTYQKLHTSIWGVIDFETQHWRYFSFHRQVPLQAEPLSLLDLDLSSLILVQAFGEIQEETMLPMHWWDGPQCKQSSNGQTRVGNSFMVSTVARLNMDRFMLFSLHSSYIVLPWYVDELKKLTQAWSQGAISNFDYLCSLNCLSGRSYNDVRELFQFAFRLHCPNQNLMHSDFNLRYVNTLYFLGLCPTLQVKVFLTWLIKRIFVTCQNLSVHWTSCVCRNLLIVSRPLLIHQYHPSCTEVITQQVQELYFISCLGSIHSQRSTDNYRAVILMWPIGYSVPYRGLGKCVWGGQRLRLRS